MKLKQIVEGLKEMEDVLNGDKYDIYFQKDKQGFNRALNTEIEVDEGEIVDILEYKTYRAGKAMDLNDDYLQLIAKDLSKAIQKGKVLKVVEKS